MLAARMTAAMVLLALPLTGEGLAQAGGQASQPPTEQLQNNAPRATVVLAAYRHGDLLWENDKTAHRIYGRPLETAEPPSGSGIDSWGKSVAWPFMDRQLRRGTQHTYNGEGVDFFHVGTGRGAGGLGVWHDNKLWTSRNYRTHRIIRNGPDLADFEVRYAPWPVDVARKVWETRRLTLPLGTHFTRIASTLSSDRRGPLLVGIGIGKRTTGQAPGQLSVDRALGLMTWWGPEDGDHGRMAVAIRVDPAMIVEQRDDADNHLFLLRVTPGRPFVYYSGSAWTRGIGGFDTQEKWYAYAAGENLDFAIPPRVRD